jgi:uncharacterized YigZ family protein
MKSITDEIVYSYEIEKSKFITVINKVNSKDEIESIMKDIKNKYKDATHYCYAYVIDDIKKSSDDGEPGGTAGVPIMESLNAYNLNYVLAVVIRYFGGIKLGAGGLTRAYRKAINDALVNNKDKIIELIDGYIIKISTTYDKQKDIEYKYKRILNKEYNENVIYTLEVDIIEYNDIKDKYKILEENKTKIKAMN